MDKPSLFPGLTAALCLGGLLISLSTLQAQETLSLKLSGTAVIELEPGRLYQVMMSGDMQTWEPYGKWIVGEGKAHAVQAELNGDATLTGRCRIQSAVWRRQGSCPRVRSSPGPFPS